MAFSQTGITQVNVQASGADLYITWGSTVTSETIYQVYVDHRLSWYGPGRSCQVPTPPDAVGRNTWVDVGSVDPGEANISFAGSLASLAYGVGKVRLSWPGGTYLDPSGQGDVQGFHVYQSDAPGDPVDMAAPVDTVAAYPGGWVSDGYGLGGYGQGGFGQSANAYEWSPGFLAGGTWIFSIVPFDKAGNDRGMGRTVSVNVTVPPRPPALPAAGTRLSYVYAGPTTRQVTLSWLASPSA